MSRPFADLKFCSTSISSEQRVRCPLPDHTLYLILTVLNKSEIAAKIKSMGGSHSSNLMSDVTVLVVGDRNTEKYRFSVRNRSDVKFIRAEAITAIHAKWIENQDKKDPDALNLDNYLLPVFDGLKICLSRVNTDTHFSSDEKFELVKLIQENGGEVSDSLTQSSSMVITNEKSGKRYQSARKWQIPNVHPLWVLHSLKRKAALDTRYYDIDKLEDLSQIGKDSCLVWDELRKRKRKKIITEEDDQIKKKPEIWKSIMDDAKKQASMTKKHDDAWDEPIEDRGQKELLTDLKEVKKKKPSFISIEVNSTLFSGKTFKIDHFDTTRTSTLTKTIQSHSGKVLDRFDPLEPPSYIIVPSDFPTTDFPSFYFDYPETEVLTEYFLERCLHYKQLRLDTWGKPFYQPLVNAPKLNVCITGFQGVELLHVTKMVALCGFQLHDYLNPERDILIINYDLLRAKTGEHLVKKYPSLFDGNFKKTVPQSSILSTRKKLKFARDHLIPILTITFIFDSFYNGMVSNINGRDSCIHCPKLADLKPTLRELVMSDSERRTNLHKTDSSTSLPKLPSPIRNKRKDNWGRLVGRAPVSQLDSLNHRKSSVHSELENNDNVQSTQIGYGGTQLNDKLRSLLQNDAESGESSASPPPPPAPPALGEARKRTRQGYKDMLNIFGGDE